MYGRAGLERFRKAQSLEPFSVTFNSASKTTSQSAAAPPPPPPAKSIVTHSSNSHLRPQTSHQHNEGAQLVCPNQQLTQLGGGQSTWQPPDWAIEPRPGFFYLEVLKDGEVIDRINLDKRRHIFGRQIHTCDFVLDHQSVSRQHAAVIPHKNGSIYVIDLGSAHGTFVANERLTKDTPVELEVGQSLRFAASTRSYILRKNNEALFPPPVLPTEINMPPSPDPSDEEAVLAYNTFLNRYGLSKSGSLLKISGSLSSPCGKHDSQQKERAAKRLRRTRVSFRDQVGGELVEVVGISDGVDVETEPGPLGVKEGSSLVGKYESLVQVTVIPKGKEQVSTREGNIGQKGVTDKLQKVLDKVKNTPKSGIYDDLYGESVPLKVGSSWAISSVSPGDTLVSPSGTPGGTSRNANDDNDDDDDLFGD
ncbi:Forkhead-associated (FHA) domain [Dillenia turbinata]|uniref:Forkhead-associated (FHA) domain n=1 Tax=Dillenia turbinata TaxID=194707 RepID=A0AAN8YZH2_9MAGN